MSFLLNFSTCLGAFLLVCGVFFLVGFIFVICVDKSNHYSSLRYHVCDVEAAVNELQSRIAALEKLRRSKND